MARERWSVFDGTRIPRITRALQRVRAPGVSLVDAPGYIRLKLDSALERGLHRRR